MHTRRRAERSPLPTSKQHLNKKIGVGMKSSKNLQKSAQKSGKKVQKAKNAGKINKKSRRNQRRMQKYKKTAYRHHKKNHAGFKKSKNQGQKASHERKSFKHKSVDQLVMLAIHAYDKPCSFSQIKKLLGKLGLAHGKNQPGVQDFQIKKSIKKLVSLKVLKDVTKANSSGSGEVVHRYIYTKKSLPNNAVLKRKRATMQTSKNDKNLRALMKRLAHKTNRGGRTYEQVVKDYLDLKKHDNGMMFQSIQFYLKKNNMKISSFVLKKVLERLRNKKVIQTFQFRNWTTGKPLPARKSTPAFLKN